MTGWPPLTFARNRSRHGFTYIFGNRNPDGLKGPLPDLGCCAPVSGGFGNILLSSDAKQTWYNGVYVTLEKAYSEASEWGMTMAYTYSEADETGGDLFSLDYPLVSDFPRHPTSGDERHRIVMTGIVGLPWDIKLATTLTLGSGTGYTIIDQSHGTGPGEIQYRYYTGRPEKHSFIIPDAFAYRSLDLRLEKSFDFRRIAGFQPGRRGVQRVRLRELRPALVQRQHSRSAAAGQRSLRQADRFDRTRPPLPGRYDV